jgi:phosphoglycolate phosphatase
MTMHVLLDLDGTISDPVEGFVASITHALQTLGCAVPDRKTLAAHIGPPLEESLADFLGDAPPDRVAAAAALYRGYYSETGIFQNALYKGIPEALESLTASGAQIYLATSKAWPFARRILEHFGLTRYFHGIYGSEFDGTRTNKADLIAHLLAQENIPTTNAVMVGDRLHDVRGAARNGLASCGVLWGYGSREELTTAGATLLLETPRDLGALASHELLPCK